VHLSSLASCDPAHLRSPTGISEEVLRAQLRPRGYRISTDLQLQPRFQDTPGTSIVDEPPQEPCPPQSSIHGFEPVSKMRFLTSRTNGSGRIQSMKGKGATTLCGLLSLTAFLPIALADKTAADYFVHSLPGAPDGPLLKMHAGYVLDRFHLG
jgi:hypothetical protein